MHSDWLAQYLVQQAEPLNHAYRLARQGDPARFANAFSQFVLEALDPLLTELDHWATEHKAALTETAYESGLIMARRGWLAPEHQAVTGLLFKQLLPEWLSPYPEDAPRLLTQLLNTLSHLPDVSQRSRLLSHLQTCLPTPDDTPDALLILSWMSGLPHFRDAALKTMNRRPGLAERVVEGDPAWFQNPWWQGPRLQWQTRPVEVGKSIWLGGEFTSRPRLLVTPEHTLIEAGTDCWQLHIDAFGQTLLPHARTHPPSQPVAECTQIPAGLASSWRDSEQPRQCLERPYDWVVNFHTCYAVLVIPKAGDRG